MSISHRRAIAPQAAELPPNDEKGGSHTPQDIGIFSQPFIGLKRLWGTASEEYREVVDWYWAHRLGEGDDRPQISGAG
jgi:hypothetical protein